jgi:hypothetical protein
MYADAQNKVQKYNEDRDFKDLQGARDLLAKWLEEHRALYGDTQAALDVRAPVVQQLDAIDAQIAALLAPPPPKPTPAPQPQPQPAVTDAPPPQPTPASEEGQGMISGGTTLLVLGGAGVLGVGVPLWATRNQALDRAASREFRVDQQDDLDKARRRHVGAITMFAIGGSLAAAGIALLSAGLARRSRARRMAVAPQLGPGFAGASATVRF